MNIKKITLVASGFKGATVTYLREEQKNGRPFINEIVEKRKHPIHLSLETMFKDLRFHLLEITGMLRGDEEKNEKDYIILESEVTGIEFDSASFTLIGEKRVFADKTIKLKTCKVEEEDGYEHFETVLKLIESIVEETKEYLAGTKKVDDVEVAMRFVQAGKHKTITEETLKGWSPEQLKQFATDLLENSFGSVVLHNDDMDVDQEKLNADVEAQLDKQAEEVTEIKIEGEEIVIPVPVKEKKVKKEKAIEIPITQTNDNGPAF